MILKYQKFYLYSIFLVLLGFAACKSKKEIVDPEITPVPIDQSEFREILAEFNKNNMNYEWFSARFSGNALWQSQTQTIAGMIRIQKDQAIYVSIAPILGIEVARALITPDSLKLLNRLDGTYYLGNINYLNRMFNTDIDFYMLQALFTGNDFQHFRTDNFYVDNRNDQIRLTDRNRKRIAGRGQPLNHQLILHPDTKKISSSIIEDTRNKRNLSAHYKNIEQINNQWVPIDFEIQFSDPVNKARLNLSYSRISIDEPQRMNFNIPDRYTPIQLD